MQLNLSPVAPTLANLKASLKRRNSAVWPISDANMPEIEK
jgi:hypothetical protein